MSERMADEDWCFKVIDIYGDEYKIWADGRIAGFDLGCIVVNKIPRIIEMAREVAYANADCEPR